MFKRTKLILIATILLSGCSAMESESKKDFEASISSGTDFISIFVSFFDSLSIAEHPDSSIVGQGFQPPAEKDAIEFAKKHRKEFEKVGEQFFMDLH
jgi:hypothetical protein